MDLPIGVVSRKGAGTRRGLSRAYPWYPRHPLGYLRDGAASFAGRFPNAAQRPAAMDLSAGNAAQRLSALDYDRMSLTQSRRGRRGQSKAGCELWPNVDHRPYARHLVERNAAQRLSARDFDQIGLTQSRRGAEEREAQCAYLPDADGLWAKIVRIWRMRTISAGSESSPYPLGHPCYPRDPRGLKCRVSAGAPATMPTCSCPTHGRGHAEQQG
jgi:hypothetical protein